MRLNWGAKIALLYLSFVALIVTLVYLSSKQKFYLVSEDYYKQELSYENIIRAKRNAQGLTGPVAVIQNQQGINLIFPSELKGEEIKGNVQLYSPVNQAFDRTVKLAINNNSMFITRAGLTPTLYKAKIYYTANGTPYYQETDVLIAK